MDELNEIETRIQTKISQLAEDHNNYDWSKSPIYEPENKNINRFLFEKIATLSVLMDELKEDLGFANDKIESLENRVETLDGNFE